MSEQAATYWHRAARSAVRHGIPGDGFAAHGSEYWRFLTAEPPDTFIITITNTSELTLPQSVEHLNLNVFIS